MAASDNNNHNGKSPSKRNSRKISLEDFNLKSDHFALADDTGANKATADETGCTLSKYKLDFGLSDTPFPVSLSLLSDEPSVKDSVVLSAPNAKYKYDWCVIHPDPPSAKYKLTVSPPGGLIDKGKSVTINFKLTCYCTTRFNKKVAIVLTPKNSLFKKAPTYDSKPYPAFIVSFRVDSDLTMSIDFEELKLEQTPVASGGFGTVWKGQWRGLDVAVKKLHVQELTPEDKEVFLKEIKFMKQLACQFVVTFIGFTQLPSQPVCLIMEFVPGGSLTKLLEKTKLSDKLKGNILLDIAKGLLFLHNNNIYHRDLKPDNVLVMSPFEGANQNVKLTDFDTARVHLRNSSMDDYATYQSLVASTRNADDNSKKRLSNMGTLIYKAPEVMLAASKGNYDIAKTDTFSFGVLAWQVWSQREPYADPPYSDMSAWQIEEFVKAGKRLEISNSIHSRIRELIEKCWDHKPRLRPDFQTIVKFLTDLSPTLKAGTSPQPQASPKEVEEEPYAKIPKDHYALIGWSGTINRVEAVKKLDTAPIGSFLIRWSSHAKGYVLSYKGQKAVEHIADIKQSPNGEISVVKIDGGMRTFANLLEYVNAMKEQKLISRPVSTIEGDYEGFYARSNLATDMMGAKKT